MSLIWLSDAINGSKVAVNTDHVVAVFSAKDGELAGKTIVSLINGTVPVSETDLEVFTLINGDD